MTTGAHLRQRTRWFAAMAAWRALLFREELRHSPYRTFTLLALSGAIFVYFPAVSWGVREMLALAREEGFDPADVSVLPLTYAVFLAWVLGAGLKGRTLWWVLRSAPVPRAILGLDRALGVFFVALIAAGPYVWGAVRGAGFEPAALVSLVALPLWLSARIRGAGGLWYPFALLLFAAMGWSMAFLAAKYLDQGLVFDDYNQEMARELLRPVFSRLRLPEPLAAALSAPAAVHWIVGLLAFWRLASALGDRSGGAGAPRPIGVWLARWRDAPGALALSLLLRHLDVGLSQAVLAGAFVLAAQVYGILAVPVSLGVWWVLAVLWWPVWKEPPALPGWLGANADAGLAASGLMAGRLRALALTLLPFAFVPGVGGVGMAAWVAAVWSLQLGSDALVRLRPAWLTGALVLFLGSAVLWIGGR